MILSISLLLLTFVAIAFAAPCKTATKNFPDIDLDDDDDEVTIDVTGVASVANVELRWQYFQDSDLKVEVTGPSDFMIEATFNKDTTTLSLSVHSAMAEKLGPAPPLMTPTASSDAMPLSSMSSLAQTALCAWATGRSAAALGCAAMFAFAEEKCYLRIVVMTNHRMRVTPATAVSALNNAPACSFAQTDSANDALGLTGNYVFALDSFYSCQYQSVYVAKAIDDACKTRALPQRAIVELSAGSPVFKVNGVDVKLVQTPTRNKDGRYELIFTLDKVPGRVHVFGTKYYSEPSIALPRMPVLFTGDDDQNGCFVAYTCAGGVCAAGEVDDSARQESVCVDAFVSTDDALPQTLPPPTCTMTGGAAPTDIELMECTRECCGEKGVRSCCGFGGDGPQYRCFVNNERCERDLECKETYCTRVMALFGDMNVQKLTGEAAKAVQPVRCECAKQIPRSTEGFCGAVSGNTNKLFTNFIVGLIVAIVSIANF